MKQSEKLLLAAASLPFVYVTCLYINLDFWNDEMYTLKFFTFVPFTTIVTDYHIPNNHIFFNILSHFYLRIIWINNLHQLMDNPFMLRLLPLLYSIGTVIYVFITGRKFFNQFIAVAAIAVLFTTIPFFNYFLQIRGYGLSMFFLSMMIYHSFSLECGYNKKDFLLLALSVCLSIYTIPLNLYYVFAIAIFFSLCYAMECFLKLKSHNHSFVSIFLKGRCINILLAIIIGTASAFLMYSCIFTKVFFNDYVKSEGWFVGSPFTMIGNCGYAFISGRYLLVFFLVAGIFFSAYKTPMRNSILVRRFLLLLSVLLIPFITSYIRYDEAPDRSFSILAPVFALCCASTVYFFVSNITVLRRHQSKVLIAFILYCQISFAVAFSLNRNYIMSNVKGPYRLQDIYYNYFLADFQTKKITEEFKKIYVQHPAPLLIKECDYWGMYEYLNKSGLSYTVIHSYDTLNKINGDVYLLDTRTDAVEKCLRDSLPGSIFTNINPFPDFHNFYLIRKQ